MVCEGACIAHHRGCLDACAGAAGSLMVAPRRIDFCTLAGPFSHRTMLTLEEKGIPYNKLLIDELNMPEW